MVVVIIASVVLGLLITGLAAAFKAIFPRLSMPTCFAISILIIGGILFILIDIGSHVGA
jgi:hypothetical protein